MNFYITLTANCNLRCSYCYGKSCEDFGSDFQGLAIDYSLPSEAVYDSEVLRSFLQKDLEAALIFYGGEPLLQLGKLREIMDAVESDRFIIQTNGLLLDRLEPEYVNRFQSIFVSLDGDEALTDHYRGKGVYRRVARNLKLIRENGFKGEVVARMTIGEETEIDTQVLRLLNDAELPISSVHWQLDALFWQNDYSKRRFSEWARISYSPRLRRLIDLWVQRMKDTGEVLRLYPLLGVMQSLLLGESSHLRCGAGWIVFNIQTDGNITPCPVMAGMKDFYLGNIHETHPESLRNAKFVSEPCTQCQALAICGGRCLYANATKLWGNEGFRQVCATVTDMIIALQETLPEVRPLIDNGRIRLDSFDYTKYDGCEIIP